MSLEQDVSNPRIAGRPHRWQRLARRLGRFLDRYQPSESLILLITALVVGIVAGLGSILFRWLIDTVNQIAFEWLPEMLSRLPASLSWLSSQGYLILVPAAGGLIVGWLIVNYAGEAKGHGVPEVMEAVALRGGRIRPIVPVIKSLASAVTIGTGGSAGSEGPIVQIGAGMGSALGQLLRLSDDRIRSLVACGAAGGVAAIFNAPIAGVIFVVEVILGELSVANLGPVVLASVMASIVGRMAFGGAPALTAPAYSVKSLWEFPLYALLGVLAALVTVFYTRLLYWTEDRFEGAKRIPAWTQPAVGGALLGAMALLYGRIPGLAYEDLPQVFGVGYETIGQALLGFGTVGILLALMFLKLLATAFTLGSGGSGGIFAPSLFIGAMLGGAFGLFFNGLIPHITAPAGAYAVVGMAAVFAGATHASITSVIMIFELTGDYRLILPLMLTVVISALLNRYLLKGESIYTLKLTRRGVRLSAGRDVDVMEGVLVQETMTPRCDTVPATMTLAELRDEFLRTQHHGFPVLDADGKLCGLVTVQDMKKAQEQGVPDTTPIQKIATTDLVVAYPDEPMAEALHRLSVRGVGRLPVVSRQDPTVLIGSVRRTDIIRAYNIALTRRAEVQHRAERMKLRKVDHTEFLELILTPQSPCTGRTIGQLADRLPHDLVLVSIRRASGEIVIPHGDTVFRSGDRLLAFADIDAVEEVRHLLLGSAPARDSG